MDLILLIARLLLAAIFVTAGLAKLADRQGSRQAVTDFGLPAALAGPLAVLLPLAELGVAVALVPTATAWWGALGALGLMLLFMLGIGVSLARGRQPECHCFGQLHSSPAGWPTLARNGALASVAGMILWEGRADPGLSAFAWLDSLSTGEIIMATGGAVILALMVAQGWLLINVMQQNGRLLERVEGLERLLPPGVDSGQASAGTPAGNTSGLPTGSPAPGFSLSGLHGEVSTLDALRAAGKPVMLIFTDPKCGPCNALLPDVSRWQREHANTLTIALVSQGTSDANRKKSGEHNVAHVLIQEHREVAEVYDAIATPTAVLVAADGTIASAPAAGAVAIRNLLDNAVQGNSVIAQSQTRTNGNGMLPKTVPLAAAPRATNGSAQHTNAPSRAGQAAPEVRLPNLSGNEVELASFRGKPTLVLFWNPGCGFCNRMLADLKKWETARPAHAPELFVVSTGTVETNQAMGLRSTVVLDRNFATGQAFGVTGTPTAVLVDADGKIASERAAGAPAVLALAGSQPQPTQSQ